MRKDLATAGITKHGRRTGAESGFSLMELIAVLGVMALLLVMVGQIFITSYQIYSKQVAKANSDTGAMLASRAISEATRGATSTVASQSVNGTTYTTSSTEMVLKLPAIDVNGDVIEAEYDYIAYYRDDTETDKIFSDTETATGSYRPPGKKMVTQDNQALIFRYDNPDYSLASRVSVYIRNGKTVRDANIESEAWTALFLRNR